MQLRIWEQACGEHWTPIAMFYRLSIANECVECDQWCAINWNISDHTPSIFVPQVSHPAFVYLIVDTKTIAIVNVDSYKIIKCMMHSQCIK